MCILVGIFELIVFNEYYLGYPLILVGTIITFLEVVDVHAGY
jgi:hypothetical protein